MTPWGGRPYHAPVRTITTLALAAILVAGATSALAESQPLPMLQASPSPLAADASPVPSVFPSVDPCATPLPSPAPSIDPFASAAPEASPAPSAAPSPAPSVVSAAPSVVPGSPAPSVEPTLDPCSTPEPSTGPQATEGPDGFAPGKVKLTLDKIADGLELPVYVTGTGDGSGDLFVVQRKGEIRILDPKTGKSKLFLDIRDRVDGTLFGERGLHAIALDPKYAKNGHFYVHYNSTNGDTNLVRFTGKPGDGQVSTRTAKQILRFKQPYENHNGGWIGFGPDGKLYLALGDGGGNTPGDPLGNGQDKSQPLAKILRVDPDTGHYTTYAWGLRNPWRASFDSKTGDLWIGDVGQDLIEEVDIVKAGKDPLNFGWSVMEGSQCHRGPCTKSKYALPVTEYTHGPSACSVIGGYVYRGEAQPMLKGAYLFSDFCPPGKIWGIKAADGKPGADLKPRQLAVLTDSTPVSFGEGDDGELYLVSYGGGIYHIVARARGD